MNWNVHAACCTFCYTLCVAPNFNFADRPFKFFSAFSGQVGNIELELQTKLSSCCNTDTCAKQRCRDALAIAQCPLCRHWWTVPGKPAGGSAGSPAKSPANANIRHVCVLELIWAALCIAFIHASRGYLHHWIRERSWFRQKVAKDFESWISIN